MMPRKRLGTSDNSNGTETSPRPQDNQKGPNASSPNTPIRSMTSTSSSSSSSVGYPSSNEDSTGAGGYNHHHHHHRRNCHHRTNSWNHHHRNNSNDNDDNFEDAEIRSFLYFPDSGSVVNNNNNNNNSGGNSHDHDDGHKKSIPATSSVVMCLRQFIMALTSPSHLHNGRRSGKRRQRTTVCLWVLVAVVSVGFVVEKMVFAVRYVTMGRPSFLYGSPNDWNVVKGCLSRRYREDITNYQRTTRGEDSSTPDVPLNPNVVWKWYRYSSSSGPGNETTEAARHSTPRRRLLIAQYSGFGSYSQILREVTPVNVAYARKWGHDLVTLEGTALHFPGLVYEADETHHNSHEEGPGSDGCPNWKNQYESQSTFNKIPLLLEAIKRNQQHSSYDQVLILDTDTMIVDLDYDITTLLLSTSSSSSASSSRNSNNNNNNHDDDNNEEQRQEDRYDEGSVGYDYQKDYFLVAYRVWWNDWPWTWDVNAGITLWNLHHPTTKRVASTWLQQSLIHPKDVLLKNDDQFFLQRSLMSLGWYKRLVDGVRTVRSEFEYYDATLIKHFKRDARSWSKTSLEQRLLRIKEAKKVVCDRWPDACQGVDDFSDDTEVDEEEMTPSSKG